MTRQEKAKAEFWKEAYLEAIGPAMAGNWKTDDELKLHWLTEMSQADRSRLVAVFDDRDKVVAMWRAAGVPCFQVAPGAF